MEIKSAVAGSLATVAVAAGVVWGVAAANADENDTPAIEPTAPTYVVVPREAPETFTVPASVVKSDPADAPPAEIPVEAPPVVAEPEPAPAEPAVDGAGDTIETPPGNIDLGDPPPLPPDPGGPGGSGLNP